MPRVVSETQRVRIEKKVESVTCDFCGCAPDRSVWNSDNGPIDWDFHRETTTVCWAMWCPPNEEDRTEELVICPECFLRIKERLPAIRKLLYEQSSEG